MSERGDAVEPASETGREHGPEPKRARVPNSEPARQRIVRVPGSRRVRLTPVPGTDPSPDVEVHIPERPVRSTGPNDDRLLGDVPPHY